MSSRGPALERLLRLGAALLGLAGAAAGCESGNALPDPASPEYAEAVRAFHTGLAAVQVGENALAEASFRRVTELAPGEPAGWADLGVVALFRGQPDSAAASLARARELAPENRRISLASGLVARERGDLEAAGRHFRRAAERDTADPRALYLLAQVTEQEEGAESLREAAGYIDRILKARPGNLAALLERGRLAARAGDAAALRSALDALDATLDTLTSPADRPTGPPGGPAGGPPGGPLAAVRAAVEAGDFSRAGTELAFLRTELQPLPAYQRDQSALLLSPARTELLLDRFIRLPAPAARAAAPDTGIRFLPEPLDVGSGPSAWVAAVWVEAFAPLAMVAAKQTGSVWVGSGADQGMVFDLPEPAASPQPPAGLAILDYDYDFQPDVAVAGPGGLRLLRHTGDGFMDATGAAIPAGAASGEYAGAWAIDLDMEGDMDLVVGRVNGPPLVLVNRGDGGFDARAGFETVASIRDFAWGDLDADGDPDAAALDADGRLHVFLNRRQAEPTFGTLDVPDSPGPVLGLGLTDLDRDGVLDLILLDSTGRLTLLSLSAAGWLAAPIGSWPDFAGADVGAARVFAVDIDNNGDVDMVASTPAGTMVWLNTPAGLEPRWPLDVRVTDVADVSGDGRLDLVGISPDGAAVWLENRGTRDYHATTIRPRAAATPGDRRINPFGIGGEVEVRAGLLYQKQPIRSAGVHFGLGERSRVDVARILWPNGTVQAEFDLHAATETAVARQRLKGSCPWVFAYDGEEMAFVTDFLWRTALGLRINAQGDAAVIHSEDWIRIPGDRLQPRDGFYDIRITAELWESHFFDHVSLLVVDHPAEVEALVDERFTLPAPAPAVELLGPLRPVARALDHRGRDVTATVRSIDEVYLDTFERGAYQGVAEDHWVEIELGDDVPAGPLRLVASGWIYPTDSSINIALAQGDHPRPRGLSLEVPDGQGGWVAVQPDLGFPAGKTKTILIDLTDVWRPGGERRLRLRTNLEIYWDRIAWAVARPEAPVRTRRVLPSSAELRYRGFSEVRQAGRAAPELPEYGAIAATAPLWRDLVGFHTRLGDVAPLNESVDDRYVIMNAGDELALRFPAPPPAPDGWTRDFVLIGDGWVKDGDYNTGFSTTVLPLPYHGLTDYADAPGRLEDDPAYRRHPEDWKHYHTRYVTPGDFHHALVPEND